MIQLINKESNIFYINIYDILCVFIPMSLFKENSFIPFRPKVKGSTLGWYINRKWVSYNQIKKAINEDRKHNRIKE